MLSPKIYHEHKSCFKSPYTFEGKKDNLASSKYLFAIHQLNKDILRLVFSFSVVPQGKSVHPKTLSLTSEKN